MMTIEKKPSTAEDEYFVREDAERLRKLHFEELRRLRDGEREALRKLHAGRCANCGALMVPEQAGLVRFLHCPACGGAFVPKDQWAHVQSHEDSHKIVEAVLNWFRTANKP